MNYMAMPGTKYSGFIPDGEKFAKTEYISHIVCDYFGLKLKELNSTRGKQNIAFCRQVCMFFLYGQGSLTSTEIGKLFKRDHTTVLHSFQKIKDLQEVYPLIKSQMDEINALIISNHNSRPILSS